MTLYFNKDSDFTIIFSDSHYREQAIAAIKKLAEYLENINSHVKYTINVDNEKTVPSIILNKKDMLHRCKAFEYGVMIDGTGEKWAAAEREQAINSVDYMLGKFDKPENIADSNLARSYLQNYIADCCRTECSYDDATERATNWIDLLHGAIGLCTETGELQDTIKKYIFYGKELDTVNIEEELGDIFWYTAIICKSLKLDFQTIMEKNIAKLKKRYPEKFTEDRAINRNLSVERSVLEDIKQC